MTKWNITGEPSKLKPYNQYAGYIASRRNEINRGWVVIYNAKEAQLDDEGGKYAVVCELHGAICNVTSVPAARSMLKIPDFCEECMADYGKALAPRATRHDER